MRAPGANLAALGALVLAGAFHPAWARASAALGAAAFLAFAFGRAASMALDGMPSDALVAAAAIEFAIGALCVAALPRRDGEAAGDRSLKLAH